MAGRYTKAELAAQIEALKIVKEHYDDRTMIKVMLALGRAGLTDQQADDAIHEMQNAGIIFRERV